MAFLDLFSEVARRYAVTRPHYPQALFAHLAALAPSRSRAWDCATGSGQAAAGLAHCFDRVDATDASAEQIGQAPPHERVHYAVRPADASGLPEGSIDLISVAQALHWFDRARFYQEARRVLKANGLLAVYGYSWFYVTEPIDALTDEYLLRPIAHYWPANNRLLWNGYRTIEFPFEEFEPPKLAIHVQWDLEQLLGYYLTSSGPRAALKAEGDAFLVQARQRLLSVWGDPSTVRAVVMPLSIRLGRTPAGAP